jgi:hypothetical protein
VEAVEDHLALRCMDDRAKPAERIFYLVNRSDEWKHTRQLELSGRGGGPIQVQPMTVEQRAEAVQTLLQTAAERRAAGMTPAEVKALPAGQLVELVLDGSGNGAG